MIFNQNGITLILNDRVMQILEQHIQSSPKALEAGGILMGQVFPSQVHATRASVPTMLDGRQRYFFRRDRRSAQIIVDYELCNSGKGIGYLGEWHTHPEDNPTPSSRDLRTIRKQFDKNIHGQEQLFLVIQGRRSVFAGYQNGSGFYQMKLISKTTLK